MNRVFLPYLAAFLAFVTPASAISTTHTITTKIDVVTACTVISVQIQFDYQIEVSPVQGMPDTNIILPLDRSIYPNTVDGYISRVRPNDTSYLTPKLPVLPRLESGYRMRLAENGGSPTAADTCKAAIASYVQDTGKVRAELDKLLGALAYELIGAVTAGNGKLVETALKAIATDVSDENTKLKQFIEQKATEAASGSVQKPKNAMTPANPSGQ